MHYFTKQEQAVVLLFVGIMFFGSLLQYALKAYPRLHDIVNLIDSDRLYPKTDINTADFDELVALPFIGEYTAANIIAYRRENGPFGSHEELKRVKGIRDKNYLKFLPYLKRIKNNP